MQGHKYIRYLNSIFIFFAFLQVLFAQSQKEKPQYLDSTQPIRVRVEDLLSRMTIEEKIGQINMPCVYEPGQGQPTSGHERGAMDISERTLREVFLPSWVAGIKKAGALGIMATYPAIDGIPVHSSDFILTKILREELDFQGLALSEGGGIETLLYEHIAKDWKEAGAIALKSGVDVGISFEPAYMALMAENIREGSVPIALLDRAVRRILTVKYKLGLFDNPYVDPDYAVKVSHNREAQELALRTAQEGIVLLKNQNNLLPLDKSKIHSIALLGPNADNERNQLGDYIAQVILQDIVTVKDGLENRTDPNTRINYLKGCDVFNSDFNEISQAQKIAKESDVAIVIVGENYRFAENNLGTDGEGKDVVQLYLNDLYATVSRPVIELKGFEKITLNPGEKKTVMFKLNPEHLKMLDRNMNWIVEPGEFQVMVGSSSEDIRLRGVFSAISQ